MKLNAGDNRKTAFFHLFLVDFIVAAQVVAVTLFSQNIAGFDNAWVTRSFLLAFTLSFLVFLLSSDLFANFGKAASLIRPGLLFLTLGNLTGFLAGNFDLFIFGRIFSGLGSAMIIMSQLGMIWHLDFREAKKNSFFAASALLLGSFASPILIKFLAGPDLSELKTFFILGTAIPALAAFEFSGTYENIFEWIKRFLTKEKKRLAILGVIQERFWITFKFFMLFIIVTWFVRNFGGLGIGLLVATGVTLLSIAHGKIFDSASDAFLDVEEEDNTKDKAKKTIFVIAKRIFYTFLDYGLAALSVALVVATINFGFSYPAIIATMWLVIDLPSAAILVGIYEKTGRDMTLGRSYRRMANTIFAQSKIAGTIVFIYEITLASFWSGPDYAVIFFRDELKTRIRLVVALLVITIVHSVLWTSVYWYGYEDITGLIGRFLNGG
jgi:MFS family permease